MPGPANGNADLALMAFLDDPARFADPATGTTVWLIDTDRHATALPSAESLLPADERQRAAGLRHAPRRAGFVLARTCLRQWLSKHDAHGRKPADWTFSSGPRGKPGLPADAPAKDFSISYSGDLAVLAISTRAGVGVDIEAHREDDFAGLSRRFLHPDERITLPPSGAPDHAAIFLLYWTIKEAVAKSTGLGFGLPFAALAARLLPPALTVWPPEYAGLARTRLFTETVVTLSGPYYLALAVTPDA